MPAPRSPLARTLISALAPATATAGAWAYRDYRRWRALGDGGLPANPLGWVAMRALKLCERDPLEVGGLAGTAAREYLTGELPERAGPRPLVPPYPVPHRQGDQLAPEDMRRRLGTAFDDAVTDNGMLCYERSQFERHHVAIFVHEHAADRADAPAGGEIAHVHPSDGSMHMTLAPPDARTCVRRGWAQLHPLAGVLGLLPETYTMVYAPRDPAELAVVTAILHAAIGYATD